MMALDDILTLFSRITLKEAQTVKLQNRVDSKYLITSVQLQHFLQALLTGYDVVDVNGQSQSLYKTVYFDTPDALLFQRHQRGFFHRSKIRFRHYIDTNTCFLEVKTKKKGRTIKVRQSADDIPTGLSAEQRAFISKNTRLEPELPLQPALTNTYMRLTLVDKKRTERITIDSDITYYGTEKNELLNGIAIVELKQGSVDRSSLAVETLKTMGVRVQKFSKYCVGMIFFNRSLKYNTFKPNLRALQKLTSHDFTTSIGR